MAAGQRNIKARRKLSDLYKQGVEVRFGPDGEGNPAGRIAPKEGFEESVGEEEVQVWVQPPSPLQREMALRDAQGSRARALVKAKRDDESEEHLTIMAFLADMSNETMVDYILMQDMDTRRNEAQRDVLADEQWKDMAAYQDALRQFEEMPQEERNADPEWTAIMDLDLKFGKQVNERFVELTEAERAALGLFNRQKLEKKALDARSDVVGNQAFMVEYELQMLFYSVRDFDHQDQLFFESARELGSMPIEFRTTIQDALIPYISDGGEAKNSLGAASGSELSGPPSEQETSEASTPVGASA